MAYDTYAETHRVPGWRRTQLLLVLMAGVAFGLMLAQTPSLKMQGDLEKALTATPLPGEDWHGNVRRSAP